MKIIIHACEKRMWYVNNFMIPQLQKQGADNIAIWCDYEGVGCLESCMQNFYCLTNKEFTWHLQDDVYIPNDFVKRASKIEKQYKDDNTVICGISVLDDELNYETGETNLDNMWWSFPCIMIPDAIANSCSRWFYKEAQKQKEYIRWITNKRGDDYIFKRYLEENNPDIRVINVIPNLIDHVDYLLEGSTDVRKRTSEVRAKYFNKDKEIAKLEKEIEKWRLEQL